MLVCERPDSPLPDWVSGWCAYAGLGLVRRPTLPSSAAIWCPGAARDWEVVVADVAAATAAGGAVLINRPPVPRAGPARVVAAVQRAVDDRSVCADAAACAGQLSGSLVLLHCVPVSFAERSVGLDAAVSRGHTELANSLRTLSAAEPAVCASTRLVRAYPHELVSEELDADLLVVGGSRVGLSGGLGLVALSVVRHARCPVLVVPRRPAESDETDESDERQRSGMVTEEGADSPRCTW